MATTRTGQYRTTRNIFDYPEFGFSNGNTQVAYITAMILSAVQPLNCFAAAFRFGVRASRRGTLRMVHIEKRLDELGIILPPAPSPKANYNIVCHANGNMLYVSGHLPIQLDGTLITGRIGPEGSGGKSIPHGYEAARNAGLNIISTLKHQLGDLDRVEQIVKVSLNLFINGMSPGKQDFRSIYIAFSRFLVLYNLRMTLKNNTRSWMVARMS
jgi:enamine deaminase RidA (YjgF/YER057c/UK114 family)